MEQKWGVKLRDLNTNQMECHGSPEDVFIYMDSLNSEVLPAVIDRLLMLGDARILNRKKDIVRHNGQFISCTPSVIAIIKEIINEDANTFVFAMRDLGYTPEDRGYKIGYYARGKQNDLHSTKSVKRESDDWISLSEGDDKWNKVQLSEKNNY